MKAIHTNKDRYKHLGAFSEEERNFICNLAKVFVNSIIKEADESSLRVSKNIKRGSK